MFRNVDELDRVAASASSAPIDARAQGSGFDRSTCDSVPSGCPSPDELAFRIAVGFRQHGHIGNVLTHISGRDWAKIEHALRGILDPQTGGAELSPLARNILELLCANRGVTGRIMRPYFCILLTAALGRDPAARLVHQIDIVFAESEQAARRRLSAGPITGQAQPSQESE